MSWDDVRAQLEEDLSWRTREIKHLQNQLYKDASEELKRSFRKALVVMLYSHFEGFCKLAFSVYANTINKQTITCADANKYIAALSFSCVFDAYDNKDQKCKVFKNKLPDDAKLHRFSRQVDFYSEFGKFIAQPVSIPTDDVVDSESNLKPIVLRKILFRLGFPYDVFQEKEGSIHLLLEKRNNVAHGSEKSGFDQIEYEKIEKSTYEVMAAIIQLIMTGLINQQFLNKTA
jgi:hypothetical protein